jgi:hypothetical protein
MKIVFATTPAPGHVNPMLGIARILLAEGHEVVAFTGSAFKDRVDAIGAEFRPIAASADQDLVDRSPNFPNLKHYLPGWSCCASSFSACLSTPFRRSTKACNRCCGKFGPTS